MAKIDLYSLLEANASLAREKKELLRLVKIMSETIKEISNATELYGEGMTIEASRYRAMPKGFLAAMIHNRMLVQSMTQKSRQSAENVDKTLQDMAGGFDDSLAAEAYYQSLIDELNQHAKNKISNTDLWLQGFKDKNGKWHFNFPNDKTKDLYDKHKFDIDKFLNDYMNNIFKIDPKNFGGDLEGEWQDGLNPDEED
jgi:hypothetical protein